MHSYLFFSVSIAIIIGMRTPAFSGGPDPRESNVPEATKVAKTYVFSCDDKFQFVAQTKNKAAWLFLPSKTVKLQKETDKYRNKDVTFRIKGQNSVLEEAGEQPLNCRNNRSLAIWEHAKLNGADFRAVGNEPGWNLEIRNQEKIVMVTSYGSKKYEFDLPEAETDTVSGTTRYQVRQAGQETTLTISAETCKDSMSGEEFSSKVEVVFKGKTLQGCGRALH